MQKQQGNVRHSSSPCRLDEKRSGYKLEKRTSTPPAVPEPCWVLHWSQKVCSLKIIPSKPVKFMLESVLRYLSTRHQLPSCPKSGPWTKPFELPRYQMFASHPFLPPHSADSGQICKLHMQRTCHNQCHHPALLSAAADPPSSFIFFHNFSYLCIVKCCNFGFKKRKSTTS